MKNKYKINIFIAIIFLCLFLSIIILNIISKKVLPVFMAYTVSEVKNISTIIVNKSINSNLSKLDDDIISIVKNSKEEIQLVDFNNKVVNEVLISITKDILTDLKSIETGNNELKFEKINYKNGVIYEIPIGVASNNLFLGNLGPKIPVKLQVIGDVESNIKTDVKEYGINNAFIEVYASISVSVRVIMPFISEDVKINSNIPIAIKLVQGNIPEYYGGFFSKNSRILSIPTE